MNKMEKRKAMHMRDMTQGNPIRLILAFAIPLFIGNIFQQVYNMVDTMVVGHHLGEEAIAAIGATSSLYNLMIHFTGMLNNGYGIIVTQRFGAKNNREMKKAIAGMIMLDIGFTIVLSFISLIVLRPLMSFMNTPASIFEQAYSYIAIIYGGLVTTVCYNMFASILRAVGNSKSPLYFLIISSLLNVVLDIAFVMGLDMGVAGAAIATVIAQAVSAMICGFYVFLNYREILPGREDFKVEKTTIVDLMTMGFSMAIMSCVIDCGSIIFQRANNVLGEIYITAYAVSGRIMTIFMQPLGSISAANSTFVGQNWGAKEAERIQSTLKKVLMIQIVWGLFSAAIVYLFGKEIVMFTSGSEDAEVVKNAVMSLRIHFAAFPVLGVIFCMRNSMQAMGRKVVPVVSSCIELLIKVLSSAILIPQIGFIGTCMTEPICWLIMSAYLVIFYVMKKRTIFASIQPYTIC